MASHPRFQLAVVADDPSVPDWAHERNQQLADAYQIPYVPNVEQALRDFDVQVAIVSSEAERHADLSARAAEAGKHIVQDKPLTTRRAEADRLLAAVERTGVRFLMWNRNFLPAILHARDQVRAGLLGPLQLIAIDFYFAKDAGPPRGTRQAGYPPLDWYAHQLAAHVDGSDGGLGRVPMGELSNEGIYPLGYLRMLTDSPVERVFGRAASHFHQLYADNQIEDLGSLTLELAGGEIASIALGRIGAASHPHGGEIRLQLVGTAGALVVNEALPEVAVYYRNQPPKEARHQRVAGRNDWLLADHFATAIDQNQETVLDIRASHAVFRTIEAGLRSCQSGQPEAIT